MNLIKVDRTFPHRLKTRLDYGLLTALAIPFLALMPLLTHAGLPNTADGPVHLMRQVQLNQAWTEGNFYPRWGTDLALGHGMPIFAYAPPFLYQLTQLFHLTGLPLDEAMKGVLIFDFLLYSAGMFLFARPIFGTYPALLAATVYVYAPYRLREAYIQGNYGQFSGLAFYPLILWAFHGLIADGRPRYLVASALALAGLLFSHNISFMLFAPLFAAYLLFLLVFHRYAWAFVTGAQGRVMRKPRHEASWLAAHLCSALRFTFYVLRCPPLATPTLLRAISGSLLGLGLAAIFWLPAFGERDDIKLEGITQGFFDFRENYISLSELLSPPLPLDLAAINPEFPLGLGLPQIIGATGGILALFSLGFKLLNRHPSPEINGDAARLRSLPPSLGPARDKFTFYVLRFTHTLFFTVFLFLYTFLALPYSQPIWENAPLIELAEFPWRMLGPAILCAGVLTAAGMSRLDEQLAMNNKNARQVTTIGLSLVIIGLNGYYLFPSQFIPWGTPTPADGFAYEAASGAIGTTSTGEFLPAWAQQHPRPGTLWPDYAAGRPPQKLDPATLPPGAMVDYISHRSESDILHIDTPIPFVATLRALYWPGWQIYLDDQPIPFTVTDQTGLMQASLPAGQYTLTLRLETTPLRAAGLWLTLLTAAGLLIVTLQASLKWLWGAKKTAGDAPLAIPDSPLTAAFFTLMTTTLVAFYLLSRPLEPLFVLRSSPDAPQPADQLVQADFADQIRLVGLDTLPEVIQLPVTGEAELKVVLYWRALQETTANYSVFLHLDAPNGQTFATVDEASPEDIPTRNWPPGLYLRNPLHLKIPAGLPPIRYDLIAGIYNWETGERLPIQPGGATGFCLGSVWLAAPDSRPEAGEPIASFGPYITLHRATLAKNRLTLVWQTGQPIDQNYHIFVHLLDAAEDVLSQADGVPYQGLYPLPHWQPDQLVTDTRILDLDSRATKIAIGLYDPATGQRLPAFNAGGEALPHDSFVIPVRP